MTSVDDANLTIAYDYDVLSDNKYALTIQSLSLNAEKEYLNCENCPYVFFKKFYDYYGRVDYSNAWVSAAFDGVSADFGSRVIDMSLYGATGRSRKCLLGTRII